MTALTPHQADVLRFIRQFQWAERRSPSLRDISRAFGNASDNSSLKTVRTLQGAGAIERDFFGTILFPRESLNADYFKSFL